MEKTEKILPTHNMTSCGFKIFPMPSMDAFESALKYKPRPDDIFIVTYPKCGTTWMQNIVAGILNEGKTFDTAVQFFTETVYLDMAGAETVENMKRPAGIKTHLPFEYMPWSPEAKYILVLRNPKDCCVSFYHHTVKLPAYNFKGGKLDDYFELFIKGQVDYGDYFDWVLSWYKHRNHPNVLFLTYEDIKKDTEGHILKIAGFIDAKYRTALENNEGMMQKLMHNTSFKSMKKGLDKNIADLAALSKKEIQTIADMPESVKKIFTADTPLFESGSDAVNYCRKGEVGDWRNHLSEEQSRRLDEKVAEKFVGTDLTQLWTNIL